MKRDQQLGQALPEFPYWPGGGDTDPVIPGGDFDYCTLPDGSSGWAPGDGNCYPYPGQPGEPTPVPPPAPGFPTIPGATTPPYLPPGVPAPGAPGVPGTPGLPPGATVPGYVTEAQCEAREASAAQAARSAEESKIVKYAAITAVVGTVVGVALGKLI